MTRKKVFLLLMILSAGICHSEPSRPLTPADQTLIRVLETGQIKADLTLIPPDQRTDIIFRLRRIAAITQGVSQEVGNSIVHKDTADLLLLRLGDKFTIERMIQDYRAYNSPHAWVYDQHLFELSSQPLLIPYLAQDFYLNEDTAKGFATGEPPDATEFVISGPPRSIFSGVTVVRLIQNVPEFTEEMKAWARQAYDVRLASPERFRNLMRVFWEKNKAAFERQDYRAVVPVAHK